MKELHNKILKELISKANNITIVDKTGNEILLFGGNVMIHEMLERNITYRREYKNNNEMLDEIYEIIDNTDLWYYEVIVSSPETFQVEIVIF